MIRIDSQQVDDAGQFDGTAAAGFWSFQSYNGLPREDGLVLVLLSYNEIEANGETPAVAFYAVPNGVVDPAKRIPLGFIDAITNASFYNRITDSAEAKFCGTLLPRADDGTMYNVIALTVDKAHTACAAIEWYQTPLPETSREP